MFNNTYIKHLIYLIIALTSIILPIQASSPTHYKNILIGERAATMGGAFSAVSDDSSATFYNPAGLSHAPYSSITGSANTMYKTKTTFKDAIDQYDWERNSLSLKPNFFSMTFKHSDKWSWALSYIVPDIQIENQQSYFDDISVANLYILDYHINDITTYVGPSISYKFSEKLSIGLSTYYFFRDKKTQYNQFLYSTEGEINQWKTLDQALNVYGIHPIIGMMWSPLDKWSLSLTYKSFSISDSSLKQHIINFQENSSTDTTRTLEVSNINASYSLDYPTQYSAGIAFFPSKYLLIASDIDHYINANESLEDVTNISLGIEYFLKTSTAIRAGYFTNNSSSPTPNSDTSNISKINLTGVTLGYTLYGISNSLTFGIILSQGNGLAQIYDNESDNSGIINYTRSDTTFIISSSFY